MDVVEEIVEGARLLGLAVDGATAERMGRHVSMVIAANRLFNLTRIVEPELVVPMQILDSLTAVAALGAAEDGPLADLGSGAGFPAVPLALVTGRPVTMVESVRKKTAFLQEVVDELGLQASVVTARAEVLAVHDRGRFSAVTARALSSLPSLVELASPLLAKGGVLVAFKGAPTAEEVERGVRAGRIVGMRLVDRIMVEIPGIETRRELVIFRRTGQPSIRLPRREGQAQRTPLA